MSLQKTIDFKNGIVAENAYITISNINIDFENKSANFNVKTFYSKEVKEQGLNPIEQEYIHISDNQLNMYPTPTTGTTAPEPVQNYTLYFGADGDVKDNAENYLLTLDKYKDAVIVE